MGQASISATHKIPTSQTAESEEPNSKNNLYSNQSQALLMLLCPCMLPELHSSPVTRKSTGTDAYTHTLHVHLLYLLTPTGLGFKTSMQNLSVFGSCSTGARARVQEPEAPGSRQ